MNVHRKERLCCNWNKIKYNWICHYQTVYSNYRCVSVINTILMRLKIEIEFENILLSVLTISNDHHCTLSHHEIILIALQFFFSTYQSLSRDLNIELNSLEIDNYCRDRPFKTNASFVSRFSTRRRDRSCSSNHSSVSNNPHSPLLPRKDHSRRANGPEVHEEGNLAINRCVIGDFVTIFSNSNDNLAQFTPKHQLSE